MTTSLFFSKERKVLSEKYFSHFDISLSQPEHNIQYLGVSCCGIDGCFEKINLWLPDRFNNVCDMSLGII